jgi:hypothetical protein
MIKTVNDCSGRWSLALVGRLRVGVIVACLDPFEPVSNRTNLGPPQPAQIRVAGTLPWVHVHNAQGFRRGS